MSLPAAAIRNRQTNSTHWPHNAAAVCRLNPWTWPFPEFISPGGIGQSSTKDDMKEMAIRVIDDTVWLPTAARLNRPLRGTDDGTGKPEMFYWDSYFNYSAKLADVLNPDMASVPFTGALDNLADWYQACEWKAGPGGSSAARRGRDSTLSMTSRCSPKPPSSGIPPTSLTSIIGKRLLSGEDRLEAYSARHVIGCGYRLYCRCASMTQRS